MMIKIWLLYQQQHSSLCLPSKIPAYLNNWRISPGPHHEKLKLTESYRQTYLMQTLSTTFKNQFDKHFIGLGFFFLLNEHSDKNMYILHVLHPRLGRRPFSIDSLPEIRSAQKSIDSSREVFLFILSCKIPCLFYFNNAWYFFHSLRCYCCCRRVWRVPSYCSVLTSSI